MPSGTPAANGRTSPAAASLLELLRAHARRSPDSPCLIFAAERLSFADLDRRSSRLANALIDSGVAAGDRVAILARNAPVFYELIFACAKAGAVMMPLNWRLSSREVADILADGEPALLLVEPEFRPLLAEAAAATVVELDDGFAEWRDRGSADDPGRERSAEETALLLYTSGTTGRAKGVMLSARNLSYVEPTARTAWGFTAASVNLVAMPLFHIGGIGYGMMALSQGGATVLLPQPDPAMIVAAANQHGATHGFFVPTVIERILDYLDEGHPAPGTFERLIYGAAPISEQLVRRTMTVLGCGLNHAYGMTETAGTVTSLAPEDHGTEPPLAKRLRSCGLPFPWVELSLVDPATDQEAAPGTVGEIRIRSPMVMLGYWRKPAETTAAILPGGWLRTGDAALRDEDGYVYIVDRYKDMIVSGGENIYPSEIENVLLAHPAVADIAVIGIPHERWGETPAAFLILKEGHRPSESELLDYTRSRLARYKCPTAIRLVEQLPRNPSGKILKHELRRLVEEARA